MSATEAGGCDECPLTSEVCQLLPARGINRDVLKCIRHSAFVIKSIFEPILRAERNIGVL